MNNSTIQNLPIGSGVNNGKTTKKVDDRTTFYEFLSDITTSCTDVAETIGIRQKCCTQYKRYFEKLGKLQVIKHEKCPHTGRVVQKNSAKQKLFKKPIGTQINLFEPCQPTM